MTPRGGNGGLRFAVDRQRLILAVIGSCLLLELAFLLLDHLINHGMGSRVELVQDAFDLTWEHSLASWFGTLQTLSIGLTLGWIYAVGHEEDRRTGWLVLALVFVYLSADDGAMIHESLGSIVDASGAVGFPSYTWQLLFLPPFALLGLFLLVFLWRRVGSTAGRIALLSAMACLAFAVLLDFLDGLEPDHPWNPYSLIQDRFALDGWAARRFRQQPYAMLAHFSRSIEETAEMVGFTLLWFVLLRYHTRHHSEIVVRVVD